MATVSNAILSYLPYLFAGNCALAMALVAWNVMMGLTGSVRTFLQWRQGSLGWLRQWQHVEVQLTQPEQKHWPRWIGLLPGGLLALLAHDPLLSLWFMVGGSLGGWWWTGYRQRQQKQGAALGAVHDLVRLLRNYLQGSLIAALEQAAQHLQPEAVQIRQALTQIVQEYHVGQSWERVLRHLRGFGLQMDRLALLLTVAPTMQEAQVLQHLQELEQELDAREALQAEMGGELILLQLTVRFLFIANMVALVASLLMPTWHDFYVSTLGRRSTLLSASLLPGLAYVYFAEELAALEQYL